MPKAKTIRKKRKTVLKTTSDELPGMPKGTRPIDSHFVTTAQLLALLQFADIDEPFLRNRCASINDRTQSPWIPKPINGKWNLSATLSAVAEWFYIQSKDRRGIPEVFASKKSFCGTMRWPEIMVDYAIDHGCPCQDGGSRIKLTPLLEFYAEYWNRFIPLLIKLIAGEKLAAGDVENLDLDAERAALTKTQRHDLEIDMAIKQKRIHDVNECERLVRLEIISPLRDAIVTLIKKHHRLKATAPGTAADIIEHDLPQFLTRLATGHVATGLWEISTGGTTGDYEI